MNRRDPPETVELTADGAASFLLDELALADDAQARGNLDAALDAYVRAVGLALQLGPAACEQAVRALLAGAQRMDADTLATLGPAVAHLHEQVREAGALPDNPVMASWAAVVAYTGMLISLVGVAGVLAADKRQDMVNNVRKAAAQLDAETENLFDFAGWVDGTTARWAQAGTA